jgi:osmotically inducible lipoprotein OsmB
MSVKVSIAGVSLAALLLTGCGSTPGDRAVSGGLLGAGSGAAIGALAGNAGTGALIGGLGGAAIGGLTSPDFIDLGTPPWRHSSRSAYYHHRHHYAGNGNYVCHTTGPDEKVCHRVASR